MKTQTYQLAEGYTVDDLLSALTAGREIFALEPGEQGRYHLVRTDGWDPEKHTLGAYRPVEPLKSLLFQPREFLGPTFEPTEAQPLAERIVVGVKNCDLAGLRIQDHIFGGLEPTDPQYVEAREKTILISCDCTDCLDVCFCPVVGEKPFAEHGFDINISPLAEQHLIDAGTERGEQLLARATHCLAPAADRFLEERAQRREVMEQKLIDQAAACGLAPGMDLTAAVRGAAQSEMWGDFAKDCVECGACNFACCTCHCFLLTDGVNEGVPVRGKQWDSCLLMNFARVAGGNPRKGRAARLRNRFLKKFSYFPDVMDCYACDGCGRCTEVCAGNIDIRSVLKRAIDETESLHADAGEN